MAAIQLSQTLLNPIQEYLQNSQQILVSPDTALSLVPFYWGAWICQGETTPMTVLTIA